MRYIINYHDNTPYQADSSYDVPTPVNMRKCKLLLWLQSEVQIMLHLELVANSHDNTPYHTAGNNDGPHQITQRRYRQLHFYGRN